MKHSQNSRRGRSRGSGKRNTSSRNQTFDSNGPEGKVRGTPQQILDKYLSLARDAASAGEHIAAEGFYQFAEHYYRILSADQQNRQRAEQQQQQQQDAQDAQDEQGADDPNGSAEGGDESAAANEGDQNKRGRGNGRRRNVGGQSRQADADDSASDDDAAQKPEQGVADDSDAVGDAASDVGTESAESTEPAVSA